MLKKNGFGFTLIEVLVALAIMSIALTALLKITADTVKNTHRLRQKNLARLITTQGLTEIKLGLVPLETYENTTQSIMLFGKQWFWHAEKTPSELNQVDRITVTASEYQNGPFLEPFIGFERRNPS